MPSTSKKLREQIGFVLSVLSSKSVHARVLKFHIWIPHGKIADTRFIFIVRVISLSGVMPLWKHQNEIWCMPYLVKPCMLGFWNFIYIDSSWKNSWPVCFYCPGYLPFWSYAPLKKSDWNLVSKISRKVSELGACNLVSWKGMMSR